MVRAARSLNKIRHYTYADVRGLAHSYPQLKTTLAHAPRGPKVETEHRFAHLEILNTHWKNTHVPYFNAICTPRNLDFKRTTSICTRERLNIEVAMF